MRRRGFCVMALTLLLGACGFQLRGTSEFPFSTIYIQTPNQQMTVGLTRYIRYGSNATVVASPAQADVQLQVLNIANGSTPIGINPQGQPGEYDLTTVTTFQLVDAHGKVLIPPTRISLSRSLPYNVSLAQAFASESVLLQNDMIKDTVEQIIRRLEAVKSR